MSYADIETPRRERPLVSAQVPFTAETSGYSQRQHRDKNETSRHIDLPGQRDEQMEYIVFSLGIKIQMTVLQETVADTSSVLHRALQVVAREEDSIIARTIPATSQPAQQRASEVSSTRCSVDDDPVAIAIDPPTCALT